jgi:anti-anti-sigma factor
MQSETTREDQHAFRVRSRRQNDGEAHLVLAGELDGPSSSTLLDAVIELLSTPPLSSIEIDLADVTFLDSAGLRALVTCRTDAESLGCRLTLTNLQPMTANVLEITGLLDYFGVT